MKDKDTKLLEEAYGKIYIKENIQKRYIDLERGDPFDMSAGTDPRLLAKGHNFARHIVKITNNKILKDGSLLIKYITREDDVGMFKVDDPNQVAIGYINKPYDQAVEDFLNTYNDNNIRDPVL